MQHGSKIVVVDKAHLEDVLAKKAPEFKFTRSELLTIQYTKLINYFASDLSEHWGGGSDEPESKNLEAQLQRFLDECDAFADAGTSYPHWLHKKLPSLPWGPDNFRLSFAPCAELGYPIEPYLTLNGAILTVAQASRILCIDANRLLKLKCSLLLDGLVVDHAIRQMLNPRHTWPRIRLKRGGRGRSYRLA